MITLYIDTHDIDLVIGLFKDGKTINIKEVKGAKDHSSTTMPTLVDLLKESNLDIHDVNDIVVVNGPGSFTGERIGVTIAKVLAYTLNIPIRVISSLEVFLPLVSDNYDYISILEKNGHYLGKLIDNKIAEYEYISKDLYDEFTNKYKVFTPDNFNVNYEEVISYAHKKDLVNPHAVNPLYVKKIEVEKHD